MEYNRNVIRRLVDSAFSSEDLAMFCFDHFHPVYDQFSAGQTKGQRILKLVDYAERNGLFSKLLEEIRKTNPYQYAQYEQQIRDENLVADSFINVKSQHPFIETLSKNLVSEKGIHDLSRNKEYGDFDFIGYRETGLTIDLVSFVTADKFTEKQIVSLCDNYFHIVCSLKTELGMKPRGRNPNGLIGFVFEDGCPESLAKFVQKQSRISHAIPQGGIIVSWVFDMKTGNLHPHKNPVSLLPPVIILSGSVYPGFGYLEKFLKTYLDF